MKKLHEKNILIIFVIIYLSIVSYFYFERESLIINEAQKRIDIILKTNKALHSYVENIQKPVIYDLKAHNKLYKEWFDPKLLSFTYIARNIHENYVKIEQKDDKVPYSYKLAATNPRNPLNQATPFEADILNRFRKEQIKEYLNIKEENGEHYLYKAMPIAKNKKSCMRCHSSPEIAPKELINMYGSTAGFGEKVGDIRAMISLKIPISEIVKEETNRVITISIITLGIFIAFYLFIATIKRKERKLQKQIEINIEKEKKTRSILDSSPSIIIINNGKELVDVNESFFNFFSDYKSLDEFKKEYSCVCDLFEEVHKKDYIFDKTIEGKPWVDFIVENSHKGFKAAIKKDGKLNHFIIKAKNVDTKKFLLIIELINITNEVNMQKMVEEQNNVIQKQAKLAAMGEMIGNIAHQWRQPLSVITTAASGVKIEKELDSLSDKNLENHMNSIIDNSKYLSQTIDDFKNLIKGETKKVDINIYELFEFKCKFLNTIINNSNIDLIKNIPNDINIKNCQNQLIQVLVNIFNNANDKLNELPNESEKILFIDVKKEDEEVVISIKDNGGGIDNSIIDKIFDPYFTTKHQSQGTGLGLYMSHNIITNNLDGSLIAKNTSFTFNNKQYSGAEFIIRLPISSAN
jgi:signal transduction histidine kinase